MSQSEGKGKSDDTSLLARSDGYDGCTFPSQCSQESTPMIPETDRSEAISSTKFDLNHLIGLSFFGFYCTHCRKHIGMKESTMVSHFFGKNHVSTPWAVTKTEGRLLIMKFLENNLSKYPMYLEPNEIDQFVLNNGGTKMVWVCVLCDHIQTYVNTGNLNRHIATIHSIINESGKKALQQKVPAYKTVCGRTITVELYLILRKGTKQNWLDKETFLSTG
jgi:hypothetical protein